MKKIIITLILTIISYMGYSQDYPQYYIEDGDTVGIILTVEQAQKIDNSLDILELLEKMQLQCDSLNSQYLILIDKLNEKIVYLNLKMDNLEGLIVYKDITIDNLNNKVSLLERKLELSESQIDIKEEINKNLKKEISRQKFRKFIGYIGTGISTTALILIAVLAN